MVAARRMPIGAAPMKSEELVKEEGERASDFIRFLNASPEVSA